MTAPNETPLDVEAIEAEYSTHGRNDTVLALIAEVRRLREDRDELRDLVESTIFRAGKAGIAELEADNSKLRAVADAARRHLAADQASWAGGQSTAEAYAADDALRAALAALDEEVT